MLFPTTTAILTTLLASLALATPAPSPNLEAREDWGKVVSFTGDLCNGVSTTVELLGSGANRCVAIGGGSVQDIQKRGCTIKTWSGADCHGSSWTMPDADFGCHSVLHAAISIEC
ncbi:hypothetical protein K505DRAFT_371118 [Melanomma pulvis-pyrius CBS 109.77]|uniref:Uncharacterized protein n=1 Tax=Melanomma pulvis-pyrius CBS 109.77 TaxID=1314802 RepID=A0A6A6XU68_9PLEO|nr:hypothetical protein K505DRAFT_371118 [Melanomma pulvis-pyrius CBS 109.77]